MVFLACLIVCFSNTFFFLCIFQPPIVVLHVTVVEAEGLEAKDANGKWGNKKLTLRVKRLGSFSLGYSLVPSPSLSSPKHLSLFSSFFYSLSVFLSVSLFLSLSFSHTHIHSFRNRSPEVRQWHHARALVLVRLTTTPSPARAFAASFVSCNDGSAGEKKKSR